MNFKDAIKQPEYDFLHDPSKIRGTLCYLTVSGSYAYGTNNENSDLDIRGVAIEARDELLLGNGMEQYEDKGTDTVVYGLQKYVSICRNCNPNALEMLGTRSEHVLYMDSVGKLLRDNIEIFLSKKAYQTFAGYATSQLRRIQNAMAHDSYPEEEKERHIKKSIDNMMLFVKDEYDLHEGTFDFDIADGEDGQRLVASVSVEKMPLRKFIDINSHLYTLLIVVVGWVFFYYTDLSQAFTVLSRMFGAAPRLGLDAIESARAMNYLFFMIAAVIGCLPVFPRIRSALTDRDGANYAPGLVIAWEILACAALLAVSTAMLVGESYNPFLYFRF